MAANANRIAGTAYLKVDGVSHKIGGSLTISVDTVEREGIVGLTGVAGYKESWRIPYMEGDFITTKDLTVSKLSSITDATIQAELCNGKTYLLRHAWCVGALEVDASEGSVSVRFEALDGEEL